MHAQLRPGSAVIVLILLCLAFGPPTQTSAANHVELIASAQRLADTTLATPREKGAGEIILAAKKKKASKKSTKKKAKKSEKCRKCGAWRYCGKKLQNAIDFGICD